MRPRESAQATALLLSIDIDEVSISTRQLDRLKVRRVIANGRMDLQRPHFEILEHTADAGVIAHGSTLAETFAHAAEGMYALMVELDGVCEAETREIAASGEDLERLLTNWLIELLFVTETEGLVFRRFDVEVQGTSLRARAYGEAIDPERHELGGMVKGVTRHMMEIVPEDGGYRARVLFDL